MTNGRSRTGSSPTDTGEVSGAVPGEAKTVEPGVFLLTPTPAGWLPPVLADFDTFLQDHAAAEKKASGMALNIAAHYRDQPDITLAMADLAVEELTHYREVVRLLHRRGAGPAADAKDPYVGALNRLIRRGPPHYLLDRLLLAAVIERRGHERFGLVAEACPPGSAEAKFFRAITASEDRHWQLFVRLATARFDASVVTARLQELASAEAEIMLAQPFRCALH